MAARKKGKAKAEAPAQPALEEEKDVGEGETVAEITAKPVVAHTRFVSTYPFYNLCIQPQVKDVVELDGKFHSIIRQPKRGCKFHLHRYDADANTTERLKDSEGYGKHFIDVPTLKAWLAAPKDSTERSQAKGFLKKFKVRNQLHMVNNFNEEAFEEFADSLLQLEGASE